MAAYPQQPCSPRRKLLAFSQPYHHLSMRLIVTPMLQGQSRIFLRLLSGTKQFLDEIGPDAFTYIISIVAEATNTAKLIATASAKRFTGELPAGITERGRQLKRKVSLASSDGNSCGCRCVVPAARDTQSANRFGGSRDQNQGKGQWKGDPGHADNEERAQQGL